MRPGPRPVRFRPVQSGERATERVSVTQRRSEGGKGAAGIEAGTGTGTENLACVCIKGLLDQAAEPATNERNH